MDKTETLPYFEDILVDTKTRRIDWLLGASEIAQYTGLDRDAVSQALAPQGRGKFPEAIKIVAVLPGPFPYNWILRKTDADKYKKPAPAPVKAPEANGHSAPQAQTIVLKEGSPLMSQQDCKELKLALWSQKEAADKLKAAIDTLTVAVQQMTAKL